MARIMALDYGKVRTGIAVTDELQLIASGLTTVTTDKLFDFIESYLHKEEVERIIVGEPKQMSGQVSASETLIEKFLKQFKTRFPKMPIERQDERFTSKMAVQSMLEAGVKKRKRQNKALVDEISATLILQAYLERN
ncbi:Holliday junction resolvase RuvX [Allomuricauda sp. SCSIO 65647]|uniref:Holliday junction resolvase RuvX n=1 Tax=Allomuricauda sp. SCSIO 65647 TaxID=2908843 RepID=UPI001EFF7ACB|nr:Holliday junction resolvase RuvX [Muricauda sp. SCSIO 65647]UJH66832.1 Holliday junction resolvase RuvX [Muricauda sp. SCSIO 65647]